MKLSRRNFLKISAATVAVGAAAWSVPAEARPILEQPVRKLLMRNSHTREAVAVTYWKKGKYDKRALHQLNYVLRDHRAGQAVHLDPKLFDLLHSMQARLKKFSPIEIVSGYRSPATNRWLAKFQPGVAKHSYHMHGMAIDLRMPHVPISHLHNAAMSMKAGGVGYYPDSDFIHVDTGPLRTWQAVPMDQDVPEETEVRKSDGNDDEGVFGGLF